MTGARPGRDGGQAVPIREAGRRIARKLREAGHEALFAGGCVRDRLLGIEPEDFDIATSATPTEVLRIFPGARGVGEAFGVMLVRGERHTFEVATFRTDLDYTDGRRPSSVRFSTAREDAERRDFTINGLFEDPESGDLIDFVGGRADLEAGILRAIGDPERRFAEDHLRLLRAVRFAARFRLAIEPGTGAAMRRTAASLALIARERIGAEVRRMLEAPSRVVATRLIEEYALDGIVLSESSRRSAGSRLPRLGERELPFEVALVAWGLDRAGGDDAATDLADGCLGRWRDGLVLSNREESLVAGVLALRRRLPGWAEWSVSLRKRAAVSLGFDGARSLAEVERPELARTVADWLAATDPASISPERLVTGDDLVRMGLPPGPRFRDLLEAAYDAQLEGQVGTRDDAIRLLRERVEGIDKVH